MKVLKSGIKRKHSLSKLHKANATPDKSGDKSTRHRYPKFRRRKAKQPKQPNKLWQQKHAGAGEKGEEKRKIGSRRTESVSTGRKKKQIHQNKHIDRRTNKDGKKGNLVFKATVFQLLFVAGI